MLTVIIPTLDNAQTLGPCLSSLVSAAVDGLVREVVLADGGSTDDTLAIAEDCGARVVSCPGAFGARLMAATVGPRGDWLLILEPDAILPEGWRGPVERQLSAGWDKAGWLSRPGGSWLTRLIGAGRPQGLLVSVRRYEASGGFRSGDPGLTRLIRVLGAARLAA